MRIKMGNINFVTSFISKRNSLLNNYELDELFDANKILTEVRKINGSITQMVNLLQAKLDNNLRQLRICCDCNNKMVQRPLNLFYTHER